MSDHLKHIYNACDPFLAASAEYYYDCSEARGSGSLTLEFQRHLGLAEDYLSFLFSGHLGCGKSSELRSLARTLERESPVSELQTNDIGQVRIKTLQPLVCDPYRLNRQTGGFIIIDENNDTVAAGMIQE